MSQHSQSLNEDYLIQLWREINPGNISWVLFEHGTCVLIKGAKLSLEEYAKKLLKAWGLTKAGTPSDNYSVMYHFPTGGYLVGCHHPDILNYVSLTYPKMIAIDEIIAGSRGRNSRNLDSLQLEVIHVEDVS